MKNQSVVIYEVKPKSGPAAADRAVVRDLVAAVCALSVPASGKGRKTS